MRWRALPRAEAAHDALTLCPENLRIRVVHAVSIEPKPDHVKAMSWIGLTDREGGRFSRTGLCGVEVDDPGKHMSRGTLQFETLPAADGLAQDLLRIMQNKVGGQGLAMRAGSGGGISMTLVNGPSQTALTIPGSGQGQRASSRVALAWDSARDWVRFSVQCPNSVIACMQFLSISCFLETDLLRELILGSAHRHLSAEVAYVAVSTQVKPIGPLPSLHADTPIATPFGYKRIAELKRGDTVITNAGSVAPVLHKVEHIMPARGSFAPVRLHAPYFGLQQDIVVAPEQRLVLKGSEVEYLFDQEAVLVPARYLVNGHSARYCAPASTVRYVQLILPKHEALIAAGCALESLYIGRIRRDAARLTESVLNQVDSRLLPEHGRPIHQVLRRFEAVTLIDQRAA